MDRVRWEQIIQGLNIPKPISREKLLASSIDVLKKIKVDEYKTMFNIEWKEENEKFSSSDGKEVEKKRADAIELVHIDKVITGSSGIVKFATALLSHFPSAKFLFFHLPSLGPSQVESKFIESKDDDAKEGDKNYADAIVLLGKKIPYIGIIADFTTRTSREKWKWTKYYDFYSSIYKRQSKNSTIVIGNYVPIDNFEVGDFSCEKSFYLCDPKENKSLSVYFHTEKIIETTTHPESGKIYSPGWTVNLKSELDRAMNKRYNEYSEEDQSDL